MLEEDYWEGLQIFRLVENNGKPFVGMTNFKGNYVTRDDVKIAKLV